jgi:hypothetical protein
VGEPQALINVRDENEGEDICARLRAAGIKCAVEPLPDANSLAPIMGGEPSTVLTVLVNDSEMDKARAVVAEYQESLRQSEGQR